MNTQYDTEFEERARSYIRSNTDKDNLNARFWRFMKYLATRKAECWGFFIAGILIGGIIL